MPKFPDIETALKHYEEERRALHVAVQEIVREFEDEGVVTRCVLAIEIMDKDGKKKLAHRNFDSMGERVLSWDREGMLRDALRICDEDARDGLHSLDEDIQIEGEEDDEA